MELSTRDSTRVVFAFRKKNHATSKGCYVTILVRQTWQEKRVSGNAECSTSEISLILGLLCDVFISTSFITITRMSREYGNCELCGISEPRCTLLTELGRSGRSWNPDNLDSSPSLITGMGLFSWWFYVSSQHLPRLCHFSLTLSNVFARFVKGKMRFRSIQQIAKCLNAISSLEHDEEEGKGWFERTTWAISIKCKHFHLQHAHMRKHNVTYAGAV